MRKPAEFITELRELGPQDMSVILEFLGANLHKAEAHGGGRLNDRLDFALWLHDLSEAAAAAHYGEVPIA
jgi:hypothetical protein